MQTIRYAKARVVRMNYPAPKGIKISDQSLNWERGPERMNESGEIEYSHLMVRKSGVVQL